MMPDTEEMTQFDVDNNAVTNSPLTIRSGKRFRTFRCSIPMTFWEQNHPNFLQRLNADNFSKYYNLQEISVNGHHQIELFLNTKNSHTCSAIEKKLLITCVTGIDIKNLKHNISYLDKMDNKVQNGIRITHGTHPDKPSDSKVFAGELLYGFQKVHQAMQHLKQRDPMMYLLRGETIQRQLTKHLMLPPQSEFKKFNKEFIDFNLRENLLVTHIFVGPSQYGKTQFALAHFDHPVRISDRQDLTKIDHETDGVIIDDTNFSRWVGTNVIHIVDTKNEGTINVKYSAISLPKFVPRIICTNSLSLFYPVDAHTETITAINNRIKIYEITEKLFDEEFPKEPLEVRMKGILKRKLNTISNIDESNSQINIVPNASLGFNSQGWGKGIEGNDPMNWNHLDSSRMTPDLITPPPMRRAYYPTFNDTGSEMDSADIDADSR